MTCKPVGPYAWPLDLVQTFNQLAETVNCALDSISTVSLSVSSAVATATTYVFLDTTGGPIAYHLPAITVIGQTIIVKDATGHASANNITVSSSVAATIDGAATFVMNVNYTSMAFAWNGSQWSIV